MTKLHIWHANSDGLDMGFVVHLIQKCVDRCLASSKQINEYY